MLPDNEKPSGKILVIDDDEGVCSIIAKRILKHGHTVDATLSGLEAISMIKKNDYDIIITDIRLPDANGLEILRQVKMINDDTDVLVVTGYSSIESAVECMKAGALDYIPKPINFDHMAIVIDKAMERKELIKAARERDVFRAQSLTDGLTGLFNFKHFQESLMKKIAKCLRTGDHFSILMLDIDDFKSINDTYGHQAGNEVLKSIARILSENCREYDTIARYGGEEFAIILPSTKIENAVSLSERILYAVSSLVTVPLTRSITISIGIATFPAHADTADDLIRKADQALYHSKKNGKNRSSVYESTGDNMHS